MTELEEPGNVHWSRQKEQAAGYWHVKILLIAYWVFPKIIMRILSYAVGFFYFLFSKRSRNESRRFLLRAAAFLSKSKTGKKCASYSGVLRHIISFSLTVVEKLHSWGGKFPFKNIHFEDDDIGDLIEALEKGKGAFLICSHLGNAELLRALASHNRTGVSRSIKVTSIVDMESTANFNRMLREVNPHFALDIISAKEINPETALFLEERLAAGELVVIAGDRTSMDRSEEDILIQFFGEEAPFSRGPFYLAALLKAPVYFVFALRRGALSILSQYDMHVHRFMLPQECTRKERIKLSYDMARSFAAFLERYCKEEPFQWYNFYNFWAKGA